MSRLARAVVWMLAWIGLAATPAWGDDIPDGGRARFDVRRHGARGNGRDKDTAALQAAVDACHRAGGGTVYFPPGTYRSGSLHLHSGVALYLDHGATLLASPDRADFDAYEKLGFRNDADTETSYFHHALIWGEDLERVAILGTGTIHGNRTRRGGPKPVAFKRCRHVVIRGVTLVHAPNYNISLLGCDYVTIDGVTILDGYSDGIDPDCCRHVRIANCHIESWDDCIVPKASFALGYRRSTENVTVTNCVLATNCNAFKLGTESGGDFRNITVSNCVLFDRPHSSPPRAGIALLSVDGGRLEGVAVSNIAMTNVRAPVFLRLGNRGRDGAAGPGVVRDVCVSNVVARGAAQACPITGIPGHAVEGVTLRDIHISYGGRGGTAAAAAEVPEYAGKYPDAAMFGELPAYGFYCRHAAGVRLVNVRVEARPAEPRPAVGCDDVSDLVIDGLATRPLAGARSVLKVRRVRDALVRGCVPCPDPGVFLEVMDPACAGITLVGNDFRRVRSPFRLGEGVPGDRVAEVSNRK